MRRGLVGLLCCLCLAFFACSDDEGARQRAESIKSKTPVVQPEDVHGRPETAEARPAGALETAEAGSASVQASTDGVRKDEVQPGPANGVLFPTPAPGAAPEVAAAAPSSSPLSGSSQLVVALTDGWSASKGVLNRYERSGADGPFARVGQAGTCVVGRNGLGWGRGLVAANGEGPVKKEGDGKTPAGVFSLPRAFGKSSSEDAGKLGVKLPYVRIDPSMVCVTDPASRAFNSLADSAQKDWSRNDRMVRDNGVNDWGVVIAHNMLQADSQAGSCVFLNIAPPAGATGGSVGCDPAAMIDLLSWLDPAAKPVLVLLPRTEYDRLRAGLGLP